MNTSRVSPKSAGHQEDDPPISVKEKEILDRVEASELGERILEWARELEFLRAKCSNLQGGISGKMKKNIRTIQEGISMLVSS